MKLETRAARSVTLVLAAVLAVGGCARQIDPNVVTGTAVGETVHTQAGVIQSVRPVVVQEGELLESNVVGGAIGGAAGGLGAAAIVDGGGIGEAAAISGGALAGAALGALAERELKRQQAVEYVVRTDTGQLLTVVQGPPALSPGQRVYVQSSARGRSRVVPAGF